MIDDPCKKDADCSTVIEHAKCLHGHCVCEIGFRAAMNNKASCSLVPINELPCTINAQCSQHSSHAMCGPNGTCVCGCGTVFSIDNTTCEEIKVSLFTELLCCTTYRMQVI
jgi:hypothetical protein